MKTLTQRLLSFVVLLFLLALAVPSAAQSTFFTRTNSGLVDDFVTRISVFRGLPVFGTESGVSILQGDRFENWRRGDQGFPDAPVRGLAVMGDRLWVGTYGKGLARLEDGRWRSFTMADSGLNDDFVTALLSHGNRLFVGTRAGLAAYDGLLWRPIRLDADRPVTVTALAPDRTGILVGTNLGVFRLDEGLQPVVIDLGLDFVPWIQALDIAGGISYIGFDGGIIAIAADGRRRLWSGSQLPSPRIFDLVALDDGALLATGRGLVRVYLNGAVTLFDVAQIRSLNGVSTSALLRGSGVWWVGFSGAGLLRLADLNGFMTFQQPGSDRALVLGAPVQAPVFGTMGAQGIQGIGLDRAQQGGFGVLAAVPGTSQQTPFAPAQVIPPPVAPLPVPAPGFGSAQPSSGNSFPGSGVQPNPVVNTVPSPVQIERPPEQNSSASGNGLSATSDRLELPGNIRSAFEDGEFVWAASLDGLYRWRPGEVPRRLGPPMPCQAVTAANGKIYAAFETGEVFSVSGELVQPLGLRGLPPAPLSIGVIGENLAIGTDLGLFVGPLSGGGEVKQFGSLKGKRVGMMQAVETLLWLATDDGLYKFDFARSFSERVSDTTTALSAIRVNEAGVFAADRNGLVTRFNSQRQVESWTVKGTGRISGFGTTEVGEVLLAAENGVFAVKPGRQEISRYETTGAQGFFRKAGKTWIIRKNRAEPFRAGIAEPVAGDSQKRSAPSQAVQASVAPTTERQVIPSGDGAFKISSVQVFPPPVDDTAGSARMGDVAAPLLVPPAVNAGGGMLQQPSTMAQPVQAAPSGNDPSPAWANYRRPPKPKNLGYFKDVLPMMGRACLACHSSGGGKYFPLNDPKIVISYFKQGGTDRFMQFLEPGNGMYGVVAPSDAELLQIWVKEGCKE